MKIFLPALEIGDHDGFTAANDIFGRAELGEGLTNLVASVSDPMVLAVDGQWGSGKTVFLKMWAGHLRNAQFPVIYFDAFRHDYANDAFAAIASQVVALATAAQPNSKVSLDRFIKVAAKTAKVVARSGLRLGTKLVTAGILDITSLEDLSQDVAKETADVADRYIGSLLTNHKEYVNAVDSFRDALSKLPALLQTSNNRPNQEAPNSKHPLVFIVDELDRCRPHFALELLERIKHFFSVPNVHFVLGVHIKQLENSVSAAYGDKIDSAVYLQKFIHLQFALLDSIDRGQTQTEYKYLAYLKKVHEFPPQDMETVEDCCCYILHFAQQKRLSLRSIERVVARLALAIAYTPSRFLRPGPILAGLCVLKIMEPGLYDKARRRELTYPEVEMALGLDAKRDDGTGHYADAAIEWWRYCLDPNADNSMVEGMRRALSNYSIRDRLGIVSQLAEDVIDRLLLR